MQLSKYFTPSNSQLLEINVLTKVDYLNEAIVTLTDALQDKMIEKQIYSLDALIEHHENGFYVVQLPKVIKVLNICAIKLLDYPQFEEKICQILGLLSLPFIKSSYSDEINFDRLMTDSLSQIGYLLCCDSAIIRLNIFFMIQQIFSGFQGKESGSNKVSKEIICKIIFNSELPKILVNCIQIIDEDLLVFMECLRTIKVISTGTESSCNKILESGAIEDLLDFVATNKRCLQLVSLSLDVIWNLADFGSPEIIFEKFNLNILGNINQLFEFILTNNRSSFERNLRNDIAAIIALLVGRFSEMFFVESGITETIIQLLFGVGIVNKSIRHKYTIGKTCEDMQFRRQLISLCVNLQKNRASLKMLKKSEVIYKLVEFIEGTTILKEDLGWSLSQLEEIQLTIMLSLSMMAQKMIDELIKYQAPTRLVMLLDWCTHSDYSYNGHGNALMAEGGRGNKRAQMRTCLRLMRTMCSFKRAQIICIFVDQGVIEQMKRIFKTVIEYSEDDDFIDIEIQGDMLFILGLLCESNIHNKELFGIDGIDLLINLLLIDKNKPNHGMDYFKLLSYVILCVWDTTHGCRLTENHFIVEGGLFLLLDLLYIVPPNMQNIVLGCVCDLAGCANGPPHILTWQGKNKISAANLLCNLWKNQQKAPFYNLRDNLIEENNPYKVYTVDPHLLKYGIIPYGSTCAINEIFTNTRVKIFTLFTTLGFENIEHLTFENKISFEIIKRYYSLKFWEVWSEMIKEIDEDLCPVASDQEMLKAIREKINITSTEIKQSQLKILEENKTNEIVNETKFYKSIMEGSKQQKRNEIRWNGYVSRTSSHGRLKREKQEMHKLIDRSRNKFSFDENGTKHDFTLPRLQTTTFCMRNENLFDFFGKIRD